MEIIRKKSEIGTYDFYITEQDKKLTITFGGNGDLYWILDSSKNIPNTQEEYAKNLSSPFQETFIITKENYYLYSLFETLIDDITNSRIYKSSDIKPIDILNDLDDDEFFEIDDEWSFDDIYEKYHELFEVEAQKLNREYQKYYRYQLLYHDGVITWHSDEYEYEFADRVKIFKSADNIVLEFSRPPVREEELIYHLPGTIGIRFRNSGSTYDPFNIIFMRMFQKLETYDPDHHQIHLEETIYQNNLKRVKRKTD